MKVVIDDKIPFIKGVLEDVAQVKYLSSELITAEAVRDADALIIRTRTKCNEKLLESSSVQFIATATIGYDHIDDAYCKERGITWVSSPGCNANSVAQYVAAALVSLYGDEVRDKKIGLVGVGNVGKAVSAICKRMGMTVLHNDPPRAKKEGEAGFSSLQEICQECDIISFHTLLSKEGEYKTYHMADDNFFANVKHGITLINAARGEVVDTIALKAAIRAGKINKCVLDCWENEPNIDLELLKLVDIATPHIAGYSADGKANATTQCVQAISRFFNLGLDHWRVEALPDLDNKGECNTLTEAIKSSYDILSDDKLLRVNPKNFEKIRGGYPIRREVDYFLSPLVNNL